MASEERSVGAHGRWQIWVTQEYQNLENNTSRVRVRGRLFNDGSVSVSGSANVALSGQDSWSGSTSFNVPAGGVDVLIDRSFTVTHGPDGYKTVVYNAALGNTGTSAFGSGGIVGVALALDRIPDVPRGMNTPTRVFIAPNSVKVFWEKPDNNGAAIDMYDVQYDDNAEFSSPTFRRTTDANDRSMVIPDLAYRKYWFRTRAHNVRGWGVYSGATTYVIPETSDRPGAPTLTLKPPFNVFVEWTAPNNGGATILEYQVQRSTTSNFASPITESAGTATSRTFTELTPGTTNWIRVRARNSQGWSDWSNATSIIIASGPRINVDGVWMNTVCYVKIGGVWTVAVPYVNVGGVWTVAGG